MSLRLLVIMDPIQSINIKKDSTFAVLLEAQARDWSITYAEQQDLYVRDGEAWARTRSLSVRENPDKWYILEAETVIRLTDADIILMRKDPPFDTEYIYTTYILELAATRGTIVVNSPAGLRDTNEKFSTSWFPQCCVPTLITRRLSELKAFLQTHEEIVVKPLDRMGGESIFRVTQDDRNANVILETLTSRESKTITAQRFIPEVSEGDKRILLIDGEPVPYALARIPPAGESRANLAVGGTGRGVALSQRDRWICSEVGPLMRRKGLIFVGLDVIGDYLTEINVTSPTCIRELDRLYNLNIAGRLLDAIESRVMEHRS